MAFRHVMGNLPDGPSALAIGRLDLLRREAVHGGAQSGGSLRDVVDESLSLGWVEEGRRR